MAPTSWLPDRLDRWFSIRQPVSYWSFWWDLLRLAPVFLVVFGLMALTLGTEFSVLSFAPLPFVFVAATGGYAIRNLDLLGGFWSLLLAGSYGFVLAVTDVGWLLLQRPTPILKVVALLTFVALVSGFAAPSLHGRWENQEFEAAYQRHQGEDS
jgi:hypothetical protein